MIYTRTLLKNAIWDSSIYSNIGNRIQVNTIMNEIVREVLGELDLRSAKRRAATTPNLFNEIYDYAWPSDGKGLGLIDIMPQLGRLQTDNWVFTTPEEFDRYKSNVANMASVMEYDGFKKLRISINNSNADQLVIATLDSLTGDGGTWEAYDTDTDNVIADTDNYVKGSGSIRFNINATGGTTAGIKNSGLTEFDYEDYVNLNRSLFVFAWITSTTNITNYKLRLGSSASAYDEITVTTTNEGTAFRAGWNLLRFDLANKTTTGSPDRTAGTYAAIFMTKAAGKISETGYRFDHIIAQEGKYYDVVYYSKYGWQTAAGVWIENSTADTDLLNADTDEFDLIAQKGRIRKARIEKDWNAVKVEQAIYTDMVARYRMNYPSEALILTNSYYDINLESKDEEITSQGSNE